MIKNWNQNAHKCPKISSLGRSCYSTIYTFWEALIWHHDWYDEEYPQSIDGNHIGGPGGQGEGVQGGPLRAGGGPHEIS